MSFIRKITEVLSEMDESAESTFNVDNRLDENYPSKVKSALTNKTLKVIGDVLARNYQIAVKDAEFRAIDNKKLAKLPRTPRTAVPAEYEFIIAYIPKDATEGEFDDDVKPGSAVIVQRDPDAIEGGLTLIYDVNGKPMVAGSFNRAWDEPGHNGMYGDRRKPVPLAPKSKDMPLRRKFTASEQNRIWNNIKSQPSAVAFGILADRKATRKTQLDRRENRVDQNSLAKKNNWDNSSDFERAMQKVFYTEKSKEEAFRVHSAFVKNLSKATSKMEDTVKELQKNINAFANIDFKNIKQSDLESIAAFKKSAKSVHGLSSSIASACEQYSKILGPLDKDAWTPVGVEATLRAIKKGREAADKAIIDLHDIMNED